MIHRYCQYIFIILVLGCNQNDRELDQPPFVLKKEVNAVYDDRFGKPWDFENNYGSGKPFELEVTRVKDTLRISFFELEGMSSENSSTVELLGDSVIIRFQQNGDLVRELAIYHHRYSLIDTLERNYLKFISSYGEWQSVNVSKLRKR